MCNKSFAVAEWQKTCDSVCCSCNHAADCYFCMVPTVSGRITKKKKWRTVYPNIPSALRPGEGISVPEPPKEYTIDSDVDESESTSGSPEPPASNEPYVSHGGSFASQSHILTQDERNDLVRHSHTFSHRTNGTILFAIWSCPRAKQSYLDQDLNNGIFSRKSPKFFISQSSAVGALLQKER